MRSCQPGSSSPPFRAGDQVFFPTGESTLEIGDHLMVIGHGSDLSRIGEVASPNGAGD